MWRKEVFNGAAEESDQVSGSPPTDMVMEDHVADNSERFVFECEKDIAQEMIVHHHGSLHIASRSNMSMQDEDFFAELGELPDTNFMFERPPGVIEERSDDESAHMGMDNVDPYNLFGWSSGSHPECKVVM
jgi:hypothetical protein